MEMVELPGLGGDGDVEGGAQQQPEKYFKKGRSKMIG